MTEQNLFRGQKIRLTAVTKQDYSALISWHEDSTFHRNMSSYPASPQSEEQIASWIEGVQKSSSGFIFALRPVDSEELVGVAMLSDIVWSTGVGTVIIGIGDSKHRGQGYGRDAMQVLMRYAFDELNLHRLGLTVFSYNEGAIRLYEQLGFRLEGTVREYGKRGGVRYDNRYYGILRSEWEPSCGGR